MHTLPWHTPFPFVLFLSRPMDILEQIPSCERSNYRAQFFSVGLELRGISPAAYTALPLQMPSGCLRWKHSRVEVCSPCLISNIVRLSSWLKLTGHCGYIYIIEIREGCKQSCFWERGAEFTLLTGISKSIPLWHHCGFFSLSLWTMSPTRNVDFLLDSWLLKSGHPQSLGTHVQTADLVPTITSDINLMSGCVTSQLHDTSCLLWMLGTDIIFILCSKYNSGYRNHMTCLL